jgi:hypothetical protein
MMVRARAPDEEDARSHYLDLLSSVMLHVFLGVVAETRQPRICDVLPSG